MVERILELIRIKKLTTSQFADEIGIQRSGMSHIISGRNNPSLEFVMKVLKRYPDVKPEWLLYGTGGEVTKTISAEPEPVEKEIVVVTEPEKKLPGGQASTLFDQQDIADAKPDIKIPKSLRKEKAGRRIEKIVVFYDDRTFREYDPEL